jgi:hypothetical protein
MWDVGGLADLGDVNFFAKKKTCARAVQWAGALSDLLAWSL